MILALLVPVSCRTKTIETNDKPIVYASFFPIYDLTKTVAGDVVDVRCFMPTSATVHSWEPTPKKIRELSEADLLIVNGANMERWVDSIAEALPDLKIVTLSNNVNLITYKGAAALGEFQLMQRGQLKANNKYPIVFGHTHEEFMRILFVKDDGTHSDKELVQKGRKLMEDLGALVRQGETIKVESGQVYQIEMGHQSGEVFYELPESGDWIIYTDRLPEEILSFQLYNPDYSYELENEIVLEGSSTKTDKITYDPHSWLSINNAKAYLSTISRELEKLVPSKARNFQKNRFRAVDSLNLLQNEYKEKFKEVEHREFIVMHYAFEYLARDFGLIQYPLQGLTSMDDPSINSMIRAIDYAKEANIKTIFYEYGAPATIADIIAEELNDGRIVPLASMEYVIPGMTIDDMSYYEMMEMNFENLYEDMIGMVSKIE